MATYKKGQLVYWYNMYTKRKRRLRIVRKLTNGNYVVEYPNGAAFGKRSVNRGDLSTSK